MAVIGSGPAGFYTAYRVMSRIQGAKVDMYEALPVPFGLVRFGVAPDHPEVKVQLPNHLLAPITYVYCVELPRKIRGSSCFSRLYVHRQRLRGKSL
jgi:hypothetical protein